MSPSPTPPTGPHWLRRAAAACSSPAVVVFGASAVILLTGTPASAHVLLAKAQPNGNGTTTLTFTLDHGCGKAPTTELTVSLPAGVSTVSTGTAAATTQPSRWTAHTTAKHVSWHGPGIASGDPAAFSVVTRIVGTVGQTFHFPTVQRCDNGEFYEWADHQPSSEHPAPTLIATRAVLASQPPPASPTATEDETGASLPQALTATTAFTAIATALALFLTRTRRSGAPQSTDDAVASDEPASP